MNPRHVVVSLALATAVGPAFAGPTDGSAWPALATAVDGQIEATMQANNIPGLTVAVTRNRRLVLAKAYGYAQAEYKMVPMKAGMRTRIGSVSKAVVTGPAAFQMMKQKGIIPSTKKLYGQGGIFGDRYQSDQEVGIERYSPILAMAIAPDDKVYTWYTTGRVSVGSSNDLDRYEEPLPFELPEGRLLTDIRAIGIAGSTSHVYTWYNDGGLSIGGSRNLGFRGIPEQKVRFQEGKSMLQVVGIDIAKSDDHVYVWYDDGTVSSGTSLDFTWYFTDRPYVVAPGSGQTRYDIRDIGIAANDHVYVWFGNGKASSGTSANLAKYLQPYAYSLPNLGRTRGGPDDRRKWYGDMTLQHLLDHRAGFQRDGDQTGAERMFDLAPAALTYEHVHRHFLRTRPLRWAPGTGGSYSNHGFGLWTLIFEAAAGKSYRNYAIYDYLAPMGLNGAVRPQTVNNDTDDAWAHRRSGDEYLLLDFQDAGLGLAAGGWTASAKSLVKLTDALEGSYTDQELDDMGWSRESKGKLEHNGRSDGGTAYVAMFPSGYRSNSGKDLSDIHIAIAANIWTSTSALESLASSIVLAVPDASIPGTFDIWKAKPIN